MIKKVKCDENVLFIIFSYYEKSFKYLKSINICIKEDINEEILIKFSQTFGQILSQLSIAGISEEKLSMVLSYFANKLKSIHFSINWDQFCQQYRHCFTKTWRMRYNKHIIEKFEFIYKWI